MKKRLFVRRPATAEEMQWARDHCCEKCEVNAAISVEKVIKHHDRDSVTETIDLLLITSNGEVLQVRNLSPAELTAAVMQRTVGFSSIGLYQSRTSTTSLGVILKRYSMSAGMELYWHL